MPSISVLVSMRARLVLLFAIVQPYFSERKDIYISPDVYRAMETFSTAEKFNYVPLRRGGPRLSVIYTSELVWALWYINSYNGVLWRYLSSLNSG